MVYIILGNGFEEIEAVTSYDVLNRGGVPVCFAGVDDLLYIGAHGIKIQAENTFANSVPEIDDHILIPGGMGGVNSIKADRNTMEKIKAAAQNTTPITDDIASGTVENAVIPSSEYKNSFQKFHFVSPWVRSTFSYSSHFVS